MEKLRDVIREYINECNPVISEFTTSREVMRCFPTNIDKLNRDIVESIQDYSIFEGATRRNLQFDDIEEGDIIRRHVDSIDINHSIEHVDNTLYDLEKYVGRNNSHLHAHNSLTLLITHVSDSSIHAVNISVGEECGIQVIIPKQGNEHVTFKTLGGRSDTAQYFWLIYNVYEEYQKISVKGQDYIEEVRQVAEDIYPGMVELKEISDLHERSLLHEIVDADTRYILTIRFPNITIRNSKGYTHDIQELYVIFTISHGGFLQNMWGLRGKMEAKEVMVGYLHSHLQSRLHDVPHFCLGSTNMEENRIFLSRQKDVQLWEAFLTQLQFYLEWESIGGGPYVRIRRAVTGGREDYTYLGIGDCSQIYRELKSILPMELRQNTPNIRIHQEGECSISIEVSGFEEIARFMYNYEEELEEMSINIFSKGVVIKSPDNKVVSPLEVQEAYSFVEQYTSSTEYKRNWGDRGFYFKGEHVKQEVYVEESLYRDDYDVENVDLNPALETYLIKAIKYNVIQKLAKDVKKQKIKNEDYEEIYQVQREVPEEILTSTSVFR